MDQTAALPTDDTPVRRWVWRSTPESIAAGSFSVFALAEILVATVVFGWLALNNPWPWTSLLGLMAAPILLLRSEKSVELGLVLLRRYRDNTYTWAHSPRSGIIVIMLCAVSAGYATLILDAIIPQSADWAPRLARAGLLAWGALTLGALIGMSTLSTSMTTYYAALPSALLAAALTFGVLSASPALGGAVVAVGFGLIVTVTFSHRKFPLITALIIGPGFTLGLLWRATFIRLRASLAHPGAGLAALPVNWLSTVVMVDAAHLPELLPRAGELQEQWTLNGLLRQKGQILWLFKLLMALIIYLPALAYRWNIKASWWLWGPVALMLWPATWGRDEDMRRSTSCWSTWGIQSALVGCAITLAGWLAWPMLSADIQAYLPNAKLMLSFAEPPHWGLRLILAALATGALGMMWLRAYQVRAPHGKALEGGGDFHNGYSEALKEEVWTMARSLRRWQQTAAALMIFTIWSFALKFALERWPDQTGHAVWQWLRPWL